MAVQLLLPRLALRLALHSSSWRGLRALVIFNVRLRALKRQLRVFVHRRAQLAFSGLVLGAVWYYAPVRLREALPIAGIFSVGAF